MISVFAELDGVSVVLFHVEHLAGNDPVRVRWRMVGQGVPPSHRQWQILELGQRLMRVQTPVALSPVEVEWFDPSAEKHGAWRQAALLRLTRGSALFRVVAKVQLDLRQGFTAVAPVPPFGVASFVFPALFLGAGESAEVVARQSGLCLANLLLEPGVFKPRDPTMDIVNLSAVHCAWEDPGQSPAVIPVTRQPDPPENFFAFAGDRVANLQSP